MIIPVQREVKKNMKKYLKVFLISLIFVVVAGNGAMAQRGQQAGQGQSAGSEGTRGIEAATQSLTRVTERVNNPETGEQIRQMVQKHEQVQTRTKTALQLMSQRSQAVKLIAGPDYKNAGQVRNDVVELKNDILELEQIKEEVLPIEAGDVQGAIDELQVEADDLEAQLIEQTSGFSLFGWLGRLLTRY
jgi:hypothetical protein